MRAIWQASILVCAFTVVHATDPAFEEGRTLGLLLGATITPRIMLSAVIDQCVARVPEMHQSGVDALANWEKRNKKYEVQAKLLADRLAIKMESDAGKKQTEELVSNTSSLIKVSATRSGQESISRALNGLPQDKQKSACVNMFRGIQEGKMDIPAIQPQAYEIMKKQE
jgi:hypothetical protein